MVIALLIIRKKRRTHTYYTTGVSGNKFNHYIDIQVRTDDEIREKTPDSKDLPFYETSFVGKGSTTILNDTSSTTFGGGITTFKGELAAAIKARSQSASQLQGGVVNGNGSDDKQTNGNPRAREE